MNYPPHEWDPLFKNKWNGINSRIKYDPYYAGRVENEFQNYDEFRSFCIDYYHASGVILDRINPSGNYSPSNCQFLTHQEHSIKTAKEHRMFNDEQVKQIRMDYECGIHPEQLSIQYGCSARHIYRIVNHDSYKDIK